MNGHFEALPPELFDEILQSLHVQDMARLLQCNTSLRGRLEAVVFREKAVRDLAMRHAIAHLNMGLVARLVTRHGASPTFFGAAPRHDTGSGNADDRLRRRSVPCQLTLHALSKVKPSVVLQEKLHERDNPCLPWTTLLDLGARLDPWACPMSAHDLAEAGLSKGRFARQLRTQASHTLRRIVRQPSLSPEYAIFKLHLLRLYYDVLREMALRDQGISRDTFLQTLPRLIKFCWDDAIVEEVLVRANGDDRGRRTGEAVEKESPGKLATARQRFRLVDRPEKCGPAGRWLSPLSAAILAKAQTVCDVLLRHGASIHGPELDFQHYGPSLHALHIPIFAAVRVMATDLAVGSVFINTLIALGADINHLALGMLRRSWDRVCVGETRRHFFASRQIHAGVRNEYYWITPLDVFVDCAAKRRLVRKAVLVPAPLLDGLDKLRSASARADIGARIARPPFLSPADEDRNDYGTASKTVDQWRTWQRERTPMAVELVLDKTSLAALHCTMAGVLVRQLVQGFGSGLGRVGYLLARYGPGADDDHPRYMGSTETARKALALTLLGALPQTQCSAEVVRFIVYMSRWGLPQFAESTVSLVEYLFARPCRHAIENLDINAPYEPCQADDEDTLSLPYSLPSFRGSADCAAVGGWTVLHELCHMWKAKRLAFEKYSPPFRVQWGEVSHSQAAVAMRLLPALIIHGARIDSVAANGQTPLDVLVGDPEGAMRPELKEYLGRLASLMEATAHVMQGITIGYSVVTTLPTSSARTRK